MSEPEPVASAGDLCGECPVWDPDIKNLFWTDCTGLAFRKYQPATGRFETVRTGIEIYGFRPNRNGGFVVTNTTGVWAWDGSGDFVCIARDAEGAPLQLNDCTTDSAGRLITASFFYNPAGPYPPGRLLRVDPDGRVSVLDEGFHLSNGLGFSPDERTLYFADSATRQIWAYDYDVRSGSATRRRLFVQVPETQGIPDGLTVDSEGFVWSAQWYGGCVVRYDPDGREESRLAIPAKQTSSVAFGGPDLTDLFVTTAGKSEPMPIMPPGYDPDTGPFGGALYQVSTDVRGQAPAAAGISPPE
ncbi:MAG: SMP-30/gluconolactonase/LRE family protein [Bryobacteraceae bacterium]